MQKKTGAKKPKPKKFAKNAYRLKKEADSEGRVLVGVNKFIDSSEEQQKLLRVGEEVGIAQVKAMSKLRKSRNSKNVESCLSVLFRS